jgi:hypothetical protein
MNVRSRQVQHDPDKITCLHQSEGAVQLWRGGQVKLAD